MEKLNKILEKVEKKEGILVVKEDNGIEFIKEYYWRDNGDYSWIIRKVFIDETRDKFDIVEKEQLIDFIRKNLDKIKWFENEEKFWEWFKEFYKDFEGETLEAIYEIEECLVGLEEKRGIMIVYEKDNIKFIKSFNNETRIKFSEVSLWYDGKKDDIYKWEDEYDEEKVIEEIRDRMAYFKNYEDFVKWVVNYWNK